MKLCPSCNKGSEETFAAADVILTPLSTATVEQGRFKSKGWSRRLSNSESVIFRVTGGSEEAYSKGSRVRL